MHELNAIEQFNSLETDLEIESSHSKNVIIDNLITKLRTDCRTSRHIVIQNLFFQIQLFLKDEIESLFELYHQDRSIRQLLVESTNDELADLTQIIILYQGLD